MKKPFLTAIPSFRGFIFLVFLLAACNANVSTPPVSESADKEANQKLKGITVQPPLNSDSLNILWIEAKAITSLKDTTKKKITFKFYIKSADSLTLNGWINERDKDDFDSTKYEPDLKMFLSKKRC